MIKRIFYKLRNIYYTARESNFFSRKCRYNFSHVTYCVVGNAGDTVLSKCVREMFSYAFGRSSYNIIPVYKTVNTEMIHRINKSDMLIIGGGGLFLPDTNANTVSGWQWPISVDKMADITIPMIIFSIGYNYFHGQKNSELFINNITELCKTAKFIGLRNNGSVQAIQNILPNNLKNKVLLRSLKI